jgi:lysophospholipase L1-like esterase
MKQIIFFLVILFMQLASASRLKPNDVIVFLGDSNTQYGSYPRLIEKQIRKTYKKTKFHNAGRSGTTAFDATQTLEEQVLSFNPTILFVMFGVNDIAWGGDLSPETRLRHLLSMAQIVQICRARGIEVYVLSYPLLDLPELPNSYLQALGNDVMELVQFLGAQTIDLQSQMRERAVTTRARFTRNDGVHLNQTGNQWIAHIILKTLEVL